jgi:hypothetical protein
MHVEAAKVIHVSMCGFLLHAHYSYASWHSATVGHQVWWQGPAVAAHLVVKQLSGVHVGEPDLLCYLAERLA